MTVPVMYHSDTYILRSTRLWMVMSTLAALRSEHHHDGDVDAPDHLRVLAALGVGGEHADDTHQERRSTGPR